MISTRDSAGRRMATVDTGGPDDVSPGALVIWLHTPRGGYGYTIPVDAKVISHGRRPSTKVTIEVTTAKGNHVKRVVEIANLRWGWQMTASPDFRVPPIPSGTLCTFQGERVRVYPNIWPGELWDGQYRCIEVDRKWSTLASRRMLQVIGGGA